MTNTKEVYKTDDMALVTFLRMNYHVPHEVVWDHNTCWWEFESTDKLTSDAAAFVDNIAVCNPREFSRQFKLTRQEFHQARPSTQRR